MKFSPLLFLAIAFSLATTVMADLVITSPNSTSFLTAGGSLPIAWTYSGPTPANPPTISVELVDNSKTLFTGPLALFSNLPTTSDSATWSIPKVGYVGNSFSIILVANVNNQATIFAQGPSFSILPEGTAPPVKQTAAVVSTATRGWSLPGQAAAAATALLVILIQL